MKAKVRQLISNSSGNPIANQFEIWTNKGKYFQSYNSTIVFIDKKGKVFLDEYYWDYSKTTGKYRNQFLGEYKNETEKKIKSKEYKLINLN